MSNNNDQVFPTSLSEIAFTLMFLLMLLPGYMIKEQKEKSELQTKLANVNQTQSAEAAKDALEKARMRFENEMTAAGHPSPQGITTKLVEASDVQVARDRLRKEIQDLNERMSALTVLWEKIEKVGVSQSEKVTREEIEQALRLHEEISKLVVEHSQTSNPLDAKQVLKLVKDAIAATKRYTRRRSPSWDGIKSGQESAAVRDLVERAQKATAIAAYKNDPRALRDENEKMRGQLQYFANRGNSRGLDHPPCWADANGEIVYLFTVETRPDGFITTKAWPTNREQDALSLPNISQALVVGPTKLPTFSAAMQPILDWNKKQDPECRHFVYLTTAVGDADARDNARKFVEGFFYKFEVKR